MNAKIIQVLIGLVLSGAVKTNAQNLNIGLSIGYDNVSIHVIPEFSSVNNQPYGHEKSFNINCNISYKSRGVLGFSAEPGIIRKGASIYMSKYEFNDLQLPLLLDVYVLPKLCLSIGPEFSYMLSGYCVNPSYTDKLSSRFKKFELSGKINISYMITKVIGVGIGYNHGLTYMDKQPIYGDQSEILRWINLYNQYWQIKLSIKFQNIELIKK